MDTKALKDKILQLAIQGKLVEQNPNDEPTSVLLERIEEEKKRLIKEGKLKKEKPLPTITDDETLYELPNGWKWVRLGNIISISSGDGLTKSNMIEGGTIPVYGGNGITGYHDKWNVENETIVIGRVGFYCGSVHLTENKAWVTDNAFITSFPSNLIYRDWLIYLLRITNLKEKQNATAQPVISQTKVYPIIIALPPLAEQKRIVEKIDGLFSIIDELENNKNELLEAINNTRNKVLQEAVQGKLVLQDPNDEPASVLLEKTAEKKEGLIQEGKIKKEKALPPITDDEIPYELPIGWEWARLGKIVQLINGDRGKNYPSKDKLLTEGIPFISAVNIKNGEISTNNLLCVTQEQYDKLGSGKLNKNDIVFCIRGSLGKNGIYQFENGAIASSLVILRQYSFSNELLMFLYYYINSPIFFSEIKKYDNGTAQPNLSAENLKRFLFPLPPFAEQKRIVEKVDQLMALCDELEKNIEQSKNDSELLMQSVLQEAFKSED